MDDFEMTQEEAQQYLDAHNQPTSGTKADYARWKAAVEMAATGDLETAQEVYRQVLDRDVL